MQEEAIKPYHGYFKEIETRVIPATREALERFTRKDLREYADGLEVEKGRDKADVIRNLLASGRATLLAQLGD